MGRRLWIAAIAVALLASGGAYAQSNFPTKPVHIYVPYPPGGGGVVASQALVQSPPDAIGSTPQAFDAKIHADYDKGGRIIQAAGIKAE
jgi:tripartite-type tricarboxylate transporter receptor subunit TctC